jgi:hypothetical protein
MKYWTPFGPSNTTNHDSLQYQTHLDSPKNYGGALFATHVDRHAVGPVHFDYSWTTLSQSGTTTKMMAVEGSELWYTSTLGRPEHQTCEAGVIVLVNPGTTPDTFVVSIPRSATTPAEPHPRRKHTLRQEFDTPEDSADGGVEDTED